MNAVPHLARARRDGTAQVPQSVRQAAGQGDVFGARQHAVGPGQSRRRLSARSSEVGDFDLRHLMQDAGATALGMLLLGLLSAPRISGQPQQAAGVRTWRERTSQGDVPLAEASQLPPVGGRRAGLQRRHVGAADGAGLAGADGADPPQRFDPRLRHGAAVCAAAPAAALDRLWPPIIPISASC